MARQNRNISRRQTRAARKRSGRRSSRRKEKSPVSWDIPWGKQNLIGIGIGIVVIIIGYMLMNTAVADEPLTDKSVWNNASATTIAPIILTLGYCVIIPFAIFWRKRGEEEVRGVKLEE